jgi:hypothetical protein
MGEYSAGDIKTKPALPMSTWYPPRSGKDANCTHRSPASHATVIICRYTVRIRSRHRFGRSSSSCTVPS